MQKNWISIAFEKNWLRKKFTWTAIFQISCWIKTKKVILKTTDSTPKKRNKLIKSKWLVAKKTAQQIMYAQTKRQKQFGLEITWINIDFAIGRPLFYSCATCEFSFCFSFSIQLIRVCEMIEQLLIVENYKSKMYWEFF